MPIVFGKVFTANIVGRRIIPVCCEKCGTTYSYELVRIGVGKGSALYNIGQNSAVNRAGIAAERDLAIRLEREAELVPCPKCNWVNQDLVDRYRRRRYRRAPSLIVKIVIAGLVASPIIWVLLDEGFGDKSPWPVLALKTVLAVSLLSPIWVLLIRSYLRRRIDPNATYPLRPTVPPGTPPALVDQQDPKTGEMRLAPVASCEDQGFENPNWAVFRPDQVQLPPVCCICLASATTTHQLPMKVNDNPELEAPVCQSCGAALSRRWWITCLIVAAASLIAAVGLAVAIPFGDPTGRWIVFCTMGFFVALVGGVVIASLACRPYRLGVVDKDRGILKFSATNPGYTALLVDQIRTLNGLPERQ